MENYYGVTRSEEYLAHYGIKGMKWGVRKAIESGNQRKLSRQFAKAQKKLAKLEKRAASGKKYAARAAGLGAAAGLAGATAIAGPGRVAETIMKGAGKATKGVAAGMDAVGRSLQYTKHGKLKSAGAALQGASKSVRTAGSDMIVDGMKIVVIASIVDHFFQHLAGKSNIIGYKVRLFKIQCSNYTFPVRHKTCPLFCYLQILFKTLFLLYHLSVYLSTLLSISILSLHIFILLCFSAENPEKVFAVAFFIEV